MATLEIQSDGRAFVIDGMPEKPKFVDTMEAVENCLNYKAMDDYRKALASALRVLVADTEQAKSLIWQYVFHFKGYPYQEWAPSPGIYQVPVEWEIDVPNHPDCGVKGERCSMHCHSVCEKLEEVKQVAVLKESPKEEKHHNQGGEFLREDWFDGVDGDFRLEKGFVIIRVVGIFPDGLRHTRFMKFSVQELSTPQRFKALYSALTGKEISKKNKDQSKWTI